MNPHAFLTGLIALLLVLTPARADDAARAELESVLGAMSRAVLAGDKDAYLEHVSHRDPWFAMEQEHWADQLEKAKPTLFTLTIGDGPTTFQTTVAEFPLMVAWRIETGPKTSWGAGGEERWVRFPTVTFRKYGDRWQFCGEKWEYKRGPNLIVRYLPGSEGVVEDVLKAFPIAKAHDDEFFGIQNDKPQVIQLYQSMDHLKATVYLNMPDHILGGWNEPGESIKFMHNYTSGDGWKYAFAHEYGHVATWELGENAVGIPWWVAEGAAELAAQTFRPEHWRNGDREIRRLHKEGKLPSFAQLADYLTTEPPLKGLAYTQGHHMLSFIDTTWGKEGRNRWLREVAAGRSLDEACRAVMEIDFATLDQRWRATLDGPAEPERVPDPATIEVKPVRPAPVGAAPAGEPADPAVRAGVEAALKALEAAVAARDEKAFLAGNDTGDPVFAMEQKNWFADVLRTAPERFEIALEGEPVLRADGSAAAKVRTTWQMPGAKERFVSLPTRFARSGSGWLYAGEDWRVKERDNVRVLYMGSGLDEVAEKVIDLLPDIRRHVHEGFELSEHKPITERLQEVKLYPTMKHLQYSIYPSYEDGLGGWNEPGESIKLLTRAGSSAGYLKTLLAHEYGHVASFELGPRANDMAWWILEGVAELAAAEYTGSGRQVDRMVRRWKDTGNLIEWHRLADFRGEATNHSGHVYNQGHHMLAYITKTFGRTKRNDWMRAMATGASLDDATRRVLGLSFDELDADWRASIDEPAAAKAAPEPVGATQHQE